MARGPGKYDEQTTLVRKNTEARGVIVIVMEGNLGDGFSIQAPLEILQGLPAMLRSMAEQIEADLEAPHWPPLH